MALEDVEMVSLEVLKQRAQAEVDQLWKIRLDTEAEARRQAPPVPLGLTPDLGPWIQSMFSHMIQTVTAG